MKIDQVRSLLYDHAGIRTYTGKYINAEKPDPTQICIEDIAHALSNQCRFGGHTKKHYSVAQHCWLVSQSIDPKYALHGLMHDFHEAYLVDLPSPIKRIMGDLWYNLERNLDEAIYNSFNIDMPDVEACKHIKEMDKYMLEREFGVLVLPDHSVMENVRAFDVWDVQTAKSMLIGRFQSLMALR